MTKKRISFRAISLIDKPQYEVFINKAQSRRLIYDPQLSEFEFPNNGEKHYTIAELQRLSVSEINDLVLMPHELPPLITFCSGLPILPVDQQHASIPPQEAVIEIIIDNGRNTKPGRKKLDRVVGCEDLAEVNLEVSQQKTARFEMPRDLCFTKADNKPYKAPEVGINYNKDLGKNEFYIFFSCPENGIFKSFTIKLDQINQLSDLESRRQKAAQICEQVNAKLYEGWSPQRIKETLGL